MGNTRAPRTLSSLSGDVRFLAVCPAPVVGVRKRRASLGDFWDNHRGLTQRRVRVRIHQMADPNQPNARGPDPHGESEATDASLRNLANWIGRLFATHSRVHFRASVFVKGVLVGGGALLVAISEAVDIANSNGEISPWTVATFAGAAVVALGGLYLALTEENAGTSIAR